MIKTGKSILLASAATLAVGGAAYAADLPVRKAPEKVFVEVCTNYEGFYRIPGTDTCLRFGGYVRVDGLEHLDDADRLYGQDRHRMDLDDRGRRRRLPAVSDPPGELAQRDHPGPGNSAEQRAEHKLPPRQCRQVGDAGRGRPPAIP